MKVAYIVDSSFKVNKQENIFVIPFMRVEDKGIFVKTYDEEEVEALTNRSNGIKSFIEPSHAEYRELMIKLLLTHDRVYCFPQSKEKSRSFTFATYAKWLLNEDERIEVIDVTNLKQNYITEIIHESLMEIHPPPFLNNLLTT